jgi:ABC-2 type transport system ATP-binding protein
MIRLDGVEKLYGGFTAVKDVSFHVREGEVFSIVGPNGAGKTTLLKILVGLITPSRGSVKVAGHDVAQDGLEVRKLVGYLPEESPVYEDMSAEEYLRFFARLYNVPRKEADKRIEELLRVLNFHQVEKKLGNLSKGSKRKVVIARSLINHPKVLVYDEPCSGLDPMTSHFIMGFIRKTRGRRTVLLSTHNLYQAESISDRILILKDGRVVAVGTPEELRGKYTSSGYTVRFTLEGRPPKGVEVTHSNGCLQARAENVDEVNRLVKQVVERGGRIMGIESRGPSMEEIFMRAVQESCG